MTRYMAGFALASLLPFALTTHLDHNLEETVMKKARGTQNVTTENMAEENETTAQIQESIDSYTCQV